VSIKKIWDSLFISAATEANNLKFGIKLGFGELLNKKQLLRPKSAVVWHPKKFRPPYLFLQPLKLATSNLVDHLGTVSSLLKITNFRSKNNGGLS